MQIEHSIQDILPFHGTSAVVDVRKWNRTLMASIGLFALGFLCLPFDVPLARFFLQDSVPGEIRALLHRAEIFGHAYGVIGVVATMWFVDSGIRRRLPRLLIATFGAGLLSDAIKVIVWRTRPRSFGVDQTVWDSFCGTILTGDSSNWVWLTDSSQHSFPSAHTAVAIGFAVMLGRFYPQAKNWFLFLATLCALNRVDGGAHYLSDIYWGAAVGCFTIFLVDRSVPLNRLFRSIEGEAIADDSAVLNKQWDKIEPIHVKESLVA